MTKILEKELCCLYVEYMSIFRVDTDSNPDSRSIKIIKHCDVHKTLTTKEHTDIQT